MTLADLNGRLGVAGRLEFVAGPGGMPHALMRAGASSAEVALHGGHVVTYGADGAPPVLWVSRQALYAPGKPIRGGVPVCWPWFGPHPDDPAKPAHGFARTRMWQAAASGEADGAVWLRLELRDDEATRALWPHPFVLALTATLGDALELILTMRNAGEAPFTCGGALHSYFTVADVTRARIMGLEGQRYFDQLTGRDEIQAGPVTVGAEVDRVYYDPGPACAIEDEVLARRITVAKAGSGTTVVWNPWVEKARRLADFGDDEYAGMLCVETALALGDSVVLAPGAEHTLRATIAAQKLT
jgi:glucose-6-phosphate 1-epimerase